MGITIGTSKINVDVTCSGFFRLRSKIAELYSKELGEHYAELSKRNEEIDFEAHDRKTESLWEQYDEIGKAVIHFIYQSDCGGKLTPKESRLVLNVMDFLEDDHSNYSYVMRPTFYEQIKEIFRESAQNKHVLRWY